MTRARAASGLWNPQARRVIVRILLLSPSWRPFESRRSIAAEMPSLFLRIVAAALTKSGIRLRWAREHQRSIRSMTSAGGQDSRHGAKVRAGSEAGFDLVAQDEVGAGVTGLGGGEVLTQLRDRGSGATRGEGVEPDGQRAIPGVDVTAAGQRLTDQDVGFVVRAGVPGVDTDGSGQGGGGVERGDTDRVADQLGLDVHCLLYTSD